MKGIKQEILEIKEIADKYSGRDVSADHLNRAIQILDRQQKALDDAMSLVYEYSKALDKAMALK